MWAVRIDQEIQPSDVYQLVTRSLEVQQELLGTIQRSIDEQQPWFFNSAILIALVSGVLIAWRMMNRQEMIIENLIKKVDADAEAFTKENRLIRDKLDGMEQTSADQRHKLFQEIGELKGLYTAVRELMQGLWHGSER